MKLLPTHSNQYTSTRYLAILCLLCVQCFGDGDGFSKYDEVDGLSNYQIENVTDKHLKKILKELRKGNKDNINEQDEDGNTALHLALDVDSDWNKIVAYLLEKGAKTNITNKKGLTPVNFLLSREPFALMKMLKLLLKYKADVTTADKKGSTPLMYAIKIYADDALEALLDKDPDLTAVDKDQKTVLHRLFLGDSSSYKLEKLNLLLEKATAEALKAKDKDGNTILHAALLGRYTVSSQRKIEAHGLIAEKMKEKFKECGMTKNEYVEFLKDNKGNGSPATALFHKEPHALNQSDIQELGKQYQEVLDALPPKVYPLARK